MNNFLIIISSFPTVIFTFFFGLSMLYWLSSFLGLVEIDALDVDIPELDGQMALNASDSPSFGEIFAGLLLRLGLNGVPVTVVITFLSIFGWLASYYLSYISMHVFGLGVISWLIGIPSIFIALYVAVMITAVIIKPLRTFFAKVETLTEKKVLGQTAVVRSSRVDSTFGEVTFDDGGAGLILKARSRGEDVFKRGDKVVLLEHSLEENIYRVISEAEFGGEKAVDK